MNDADVLAARAAADAGVTIRVVSAPDDLDTFRTTMRAVWGPEVVAPRNLLRGLALGGAGLHLAERDGAAVGFALGWMGWAGGPHFHSHQVGVIDGLRGSGVGLALKLAQRAACLDHGVTEMRWTFDPVLRANATFNLVRLGARIIAFIPHCYGDRTDAFNTGDTTDRVEVSWRLDEPVGGAYVEPSPDDTVVAIPDDYRALRADDPAAAAAVRTATATAFGDTFAGGGIVRGLSPRGYVLSGPDGARR